jgi:predicted amino acid racemase
MQSTRKIDAVKMADRSIMSIINQCIELTRGDPVSVRVAYSADGSGYESNAKKKLRQ